MLGWGDREILSHLWEHSWPRGGRVERHRGPAMRPQSHNADMPCSSHAWGLPRWHSGTGSACQCRSCKRHGFNSWVGKTPQSSKRHPAPVFLPGKSHGQRSLAGYSPWGCKESDMTEHTRTCAHIHTQTHTHTHHMPYKDSMDVHARKTPAMLVEG